MTKKLFILLVGFISIFSFLSIGLFFPNESDAPVLKEKGCVVLNYHRVRPNDSLLNLVEDMTSLYTKDREIEDYSVHTDAFEKQMKELKKQQVTFLTPKDLAKAMYNNKPLPDKCAIVTFDDADVTTYQYAYPILKQYDIPFTVFVITGQMGSDQFHGLKMMTLEQLNEMVDSGLVTVGSHTHNMHYLLNNKKPPFLYPEYQQQFKKDIEKANADFRKHLGFKPKYFAYPYGTGTEATNELLKEQGYKLLFTLNSGIVQHDDSPFCIERILITKSSWKAIQDWLNE